jgi:hypothetical protein
VTYEEMISEFWEKAEKLSLFFKNMEKIHEKYAFLPNSDKLQNVESQRTSRHTKAA